MGKAELEAYHQGRMKVIRYEIRKEFRKYSGNTT
tara:strand:- start:103 stop:204 length:102 start_codon:yes stop_codon:yes gene_type:complete